MRYEATFLHAVRLAFEPVVEPADLLSGQIDHRLWAEINVAEMPLTQGHVRPGADDRARALASRLTSAFGADGPIQQHAAIAVIPPADDVQVGDRDLAYVGVQLPRVGMRVLEPVMNGLGLVLKNLARQVEVGESSAISPRRRSPTLAVRRPGPWFLRGRYGSACRATCRPSTNAVADPVGWYRDLPGRYSGPEC